jgi:hypothetical protein
MKKWIIAIVALVAVWAIAYMTTGESGLNQTTNTASAEYQQIDLGHNGLNTVPETTTLSAGKDNKFVITPDSNGQWCMSTIKREGTGPADAKIVQKWKAIEFAINDAQPGEYNFVFAWMWMKQGSIIIEA